MTEFDLLTRSIRCEKCGEWWHQGTSHYCKPVNQLDEAVRKSETRVCVLLKQMDELLSDIAQRDRCIAELKAQINDAGDTDIDWYRQELSKSTVVLKDLRKQIAELEKDVDFWTSEAARIGKERNRAIDWLASLGIRLSFEVVPAESKEGDN